MIQKTQIALIENIQGAFSYLDDGRRAVSSYREDIERLCEFEIVDGVWGPKLNPDGTFAMRITDDDLMGPVNETTGLRPMAPFEFGAQDLANAIFGTFSMLATIPSELGLLIGKVRR